MIWVRRMRRLRSCWRGLCEVCSPFRAGHPPLDGVACAVSRPLRFAKGAYAHPLAALWIPACAGMTNGGGNDGGCEGMAVTGILCVLASLVRVPVVGLLGLREGPILSPPLWIPAFAGMTDGGRNDGDLR